MANRRGGVNTLDRFRPTRRARPHLKGGSWGGRPDFLPRPWIIGIRDYGDNWVSGVNNPFPFHLRGYETGIQNTVFEYRKKKPWKPKSKKINIGIRNRNWKCKPVFKTETGNPVLETQKPFSVSNPDLYKIVRYFQPRSGECNNNFLV